MTDVKNLCKEYIEDKFVSDGGFWYSKIELVDELEKLCSWLYELDATLFLLKNMDDESFKKLSDGTSSAPLRMMFKGLHHTAPSFEYLDELRKLYINELEEEQIQKLRKLQYFRTRCLLRNAPINQSIEELEQLYWDGNGTASKIIENATCARYTQENIISECTRLGLSLNAA